MDKIKIKKTIGTVINVLIWVFVALSLLITVLVISAQNSKDGVPDLFGKSLITIETGSMDPTYKEGDLVLMTKISKAEKLELKPGQIITFRTKIDINGDGVKGDLNTHRIHSHEEGSLTFVTKGDHNLIPDNEGKTPYTVHVDDIIGVCGEDDNIPGLGNVINFLRSKLGFFICIVLPLALFFLYEVYNVLSLILSERSKKVAETNAEKEEEIKRRAIEEYLAKQKAEEAAEAKEKTEAEAQTAEEKTESAEENTTSDSNDTK